MATAPDLLARAVPNLATPRNGPPPPPAPPPQAVPPGGRAAPSLAQRSHSISTKLALSFTLIGALAILIFFLATLYIANNTLEARALDQLQSTRAALQSAVVTYFDNSRNDIASMAQSKTVIDAVVSLQKARRKLKEELTAEGIDADAQSETMLILRARVAEFYETKLLEPLKSVRPNLGADPETWMPQDDEAILLQYTYTVANPAPLGSKNVGASAEEIAQFRDVDPNLRAAFSKTTYAREHDAYHRFFQGHAQRFGYADIYVCDPDGYIVYSVAKNLDFQGNLADGPDRQSGLGAAFAQGKEAASLQTRVPHITDLAPYAKAFDIPSMFLSAPVLNERNVPVAVLIFRLSGAALNRMLTFSGMQAEVGLGRSGEAYLVGFDPARKGWFMRTDARDAQDLPSAQRRELLAPDGSPGGTTTIGTLPIDTEPTRSLGQSSKRIGDYEGYRGTTVLGSWDALNIEGLKWAIICEQDQADALQVATTFRNRLGLIGLGVLLAIFAFAFFLSKNLTRPIAELDRVIKRIATGDEAARAEIMSRDEIGMLAGSFNQLIEDRNNTQRRLADEHKRLQTNIHDLLLVVSDASEGKLNVRARVTEGALGNIADGMNLMFENVGDLILSAKQASRRVAETANQIAQIARDLASGAEVQARETGQTTSNVQELNAQAQQVLDNCQEATKAAELARSAAEAGASAVHQVVFGMERIRENVQANAKKIKRLGDRSMEISSIVRSISQISAQTDMLALNASIEAARAGEQGRGFTVVAEQVRVLADRTKSLTMEIDDLVTAMQSETQEAVAQMEIQTHDVEDGASRAQTAGHSLENIVQASGTSSRLVAQINQAASIQAARTHEMLATVANVNRVTEATKTKVNEARAASEQLSKLSAELDKNLAQFQVGSSNGAL